MFKEIFFVIDLVIIMLCEVIFVMKTTRDSCLYVVLMIMLFMCDQNGHNFKKKKNSFKDEG